VVLAAGVPKKAKTPVVVLLAKLYAQLAAGELESEREGMHTGA
jgi:hypothetical protein